MSDRPGRTGLMRSKVKMLKRTQTMYADYTRSTASTSDAPNIHPFLRQESAISLDGDLPTDPTDRFESLCRITSTSQQNQMKSSDHQSSIPNLDQAARRGRRPAIVDEKNLIGESSTDNAETQQSGSQSTIISPGDLPPSSPAMVPSVNVFQERQRRMLRKQHTVGDFSTRSSNTISSPDYDLRRRQNVFLKLIERRSRSKESLLDLSDALQRLKPSEFRDHYLEAYRASHWSTLKSTDKQSSVDEVNTEKVNVKEIQRREAVWELFTSELIFFTDHLMVLKHCFMEPLKKLQVDGHLMFVELSNLFGNLDDLCYISHTLCRELISKFVQEGIDKDFGSVDALLRPLKRWSEVSKDGEVYHNYCLIYDSALAYLDKLRKNEQFNEFEKWCEQDPRCRRLQLTDLLVAPIQHYMKIPLMLAGIRRYTEDVSGQQMLSTCLSKVEAQLKSLEDKMHWLRNFERLQEIQSQLIWPTVSELDPRVFIPEMLRNSLNRQPCERLIANPKRQLLHEGSLVLSDGSKLIDVFAFLFDDIFLITRIKKHPKKKSFPENPLISRNLTEGGVFVVYRQAIALDRFTIHDVGNSEAIANGLRHAIVLVLISRFQQITGVYTLQASNELDKERWLEKLRHSQEMFQEKLRRKIYALYPNYYINKHSKVLTLKSSISISTSGEEVDHRTIPSSSKMTQTLINISWNDEASETPGEQTQRAHSYSPHAKLPADHGNKFCQNHPCAANSLGLRDLQERVLEGSYDRNKLESLRKGLPVITQPSPEASVLLPDGRSSSRGSKDEITGIDTKSQSTCSSRPAELCSDGLSSASDALCSLNSDLMGPVSFTPPLSPTLHTPCARLPLEIIPPSYDEFLPQNSTSPNQESQIRLTAPLTRTTSCVETTSKPPK